MASRALVAAVALLGSLGVSALVYLLTDSLLVFLVLPFVPFLLGGRGEAADGAADESSAVRTCPECGFRTADADHRYCPRDGTRLD